MDERFRWTPGAREELKARLLAARLALIDEGTYPSLAALRARLDVSDKAIRRARAALIASGAIDDDFRGPTMREQRRNATEVMVSQRRGAREELKARLLGILLDHAARGLYPSVRKLSEGFAHEGMVRELRDELRDEGLYRLPPGRETGPRPCVGLDGSTAESRKAIEDNRLAILAEKIGRGERPATRPVMVYHSPYCRPREDRR